MIEDRRRWNAKYGEQKHPTEPGAVVMEHCGLAHMGRALDIAAGNGRNAAWLAGLGFEVDAVDISDTGLRQMPRHERLHPVCVDLDRFDIPAGRYALIVNIRFLSRRLFPYIREGLAPGGLLIFESFLENPAPSSGQAPSNRDYLLRKNELLHAFLSLRILFYREAPAPENGRPHPLCSLVARRTA